MYKELTVTPCNCSSTPSPSLWALLYIYCFAWIVVFDRSEKRMIRSLTLECQLGQIFQHLWERLSKYNDVERSNKPLIMTICFAFMISWITPVRWLAEFDVMVSGASRLAKGGHRLTVGSLKPPTWWHRKGGVVIVVVKFPGALVMLLYGNV